MEFHTRLSTASVPFSTPPMSNQKLRTAITKGLKDKGIVFRSAPPKRSIMMEDALISYIKKGHTHNNACDMTGVDRQTFIRWRRCERPLEGMDEFGNVIDGDDARCWKCKGCALQKKLYKAEASFVDHHMSVVADAKTKEGEPIWVASTWLLEHVRSDLFATRSIQDNNHVIDIGSDNAKRLASAILYGAIAGGAKIGGGA